MLAKAHMPVICLALSVPHMGFEGAQERGGEEYNTWDLRCPGWVGEGACWRGCTQNVNDLRLGRVVQK